MTTDTHTTPALDTPVSLIGAYLDAMPTRPGVVAPTTTVTVMADDLMRFSHTRRLAGDTIVQSSPVSVLGKAAYQVTYRTGE